MAIRDLLWACPACGEHEGLVAARGGEACRKCGARVRRGRGATIAVEAPGRPLLVRPAWEWVDALAAPEDAGRPEGHAILREADAALPVREGSELLGFVERFGPKIPGTVRLGDDALTFLPDSGGAERIWRLLDVTAVQPASSTLQLKVRTQPVVTLRFTDGSVRLWEHRIQQRLRAAWRAAGRGEIVEFQPRVTTR